MLDKSLLLECRKRNRYLAPSSLTIKKNLTTDPGTCEVFLTLEEGFGFPIVHTRMSGGIFRSHILYIISVICSVESLRQFTAVQQTGDDVVRIVLQNQIRILVDLVSHRTV